MSGWVRSFIPLKSARLRGEFELVIVSDLPHNAGIRSRAPPLRRPAPAGEMLLFTGGVAEYAQFRGGCGPTRCSADGMRDGECDVGGHGHYFDTE